MSSKNITLALLKSRKWLFGTDIEDKGGSLRRLREFRDQFEIKTRKTAEGYQYRLVGPR